MWDYVTDGVELQEDNTITAEHYEAIQGPIQKLDAATGDYGFAPRRLCVP